MEKKMMFRTNQKVLSVKVVEYLASLNEKRNENFAMKVAWEETLKVREEKAKMIFYKEKLREEEKASSGKKSQK